MGRREARGAARAREADLRVLDAELARVRLRIAAELERSLRAVSSARTRLALVGSAVTDAGAALAAEEERFRMGAARSRHVLDAQKDLTKAVRRQNLAAAALLRAYADYAYAAGDPATGVDTHAKGEEP